MDMGTLVVGRARSCYALFIRLGEGLPLPSCWCPQLQMGKNSLSVSSATNSLCVCLHLSVWPVLIKSSLTFSSEML